MTEWGATPIERWETTDCRDSMRIFIEVLWNSMTDGKAETKRQSSFFLVEMAQGFCWKISSDLI